MSTEKKTTPPPAAEQAQQPAAEAQQQPASELVNIDKNVSENVMARVKFFQETGALNLPDNYSPGNALKIAWLMLQEQTVGESKRPVLDVVSKVSVANSLLKMIIWGLNPAKHQCAFVAYGNQLACQRQYQGTIAMAKRHGVEDVSGCAVFKGDVFEFTIDPKTGNKTVTKHEQTLENIEAFEVVAAYATKFYKDGKTVTEVMSIGQIKRAWNMGMAKGNSKAHNNFTDEMALKTVYGRLLKKDIETSDDSDVLDENDKPPMDQLTENTKLEISENANTKEIGFTESEVTDAPLQTAPVAQPLPEKEKVTQAPPAAAPQAKSGPLF